MLARGRLRPEPGGEPGFEHVRLGPPPTRARAVTDSVLVRVGGDLTGRVGDYVDVPVTVDLSGAPGRQLGSYRAQLTWHPGLLVFVQLGNGNFATPQANTDSTGSGTLRATAVLPAGAGGLVVPPAPPVSTRRLCRVP